MRRLFPQPAGKFSGIQRKNNNRFTEIHTDLPDKCLKQKEVDQAALILLNKYQLRHFMYSGYINTIFCPGCCLL